MLEFVKRGPDGTAEKVLVLNLPPPIEFRN